MTEICTLCSLGEHTRCSKCGCWCGPDLEIRIGSSTHRKLEELQNSGVFGKTYTVEDILQRIVEREYEELEPKNYQTQGFERQ